MSSLNDAVSNLVEFIKNYESDTFSSSNKNLTREQAEMIAEQLISNWIFDDLDGVDLTEIYEDLF